MRELGLDEIQNLESGEIIPSFTATIKKVFQQTTGQGNYGTWFAQGMTLSDGTNEVHASWFGEDDLSDIEGEARRFESTQTQYGLKGLAWEIKTKNGKKYEGIKITEVAKIKPINLSGGSDAGEPSNTERGVKKSEMGTDQRTNPPPAQNSLDGITEARQHLCQAANLYNLCVKAVETIIAPGLPEIAQTSDQFQATVGTLFIEASRNGFVAKMPIKPVRNGNDKAEGIQGKKEPNEHQYPEGEAPF